jgi:hypothetical protein
MRPFVIACGVLVTAVCFAGMGVELAEAEVGVFSDGFQDNSIDTSLWSVGGRRYSWTPSDQGSWVHSQNESVYDPGNPDGYLRLRVSGPYTGNSYGAISWIRSNYNFNDGVSHLLNFCWMPVATVNDNHNNNYFIQITGNDPPLFAEKNFLADWQGGALPAGTKSLLWSRATSGTWVPTGQISSTETLDSLQSVEYAWSAVIDPAGTARLYNGPDATGVMLREESLNTGDAWYFRLGVADATSAGFGAGDVQLNLYSFLASGVPEPSTLILLAVGTVGLLAYAWRKRRA